MIIRVNRSSQMKKLLQSKTREKFTFVPFIEVPFENPILEGIS